MPYYQNSLYGRGVPSYAEQLSPLADVFKAFAPNPMRDLQIQGYVSKANLEKIKGSEITNRLDGQKHAADAWRDNDTSEAYASILQGGDAQQMAALPEFTRGGYAARGIRDSGAVDQSTLANLVVGAGGNYKDTQLGFTADQGRQLQQNVNTTNASRYGSELQAGASRYGADQQLTGRIYDANVGLLKPVGGRYGAGTGAGTSVGGSQGKPPVLAPKMLTEMDAQIRAQLPGGFDPVETDMADANARAGAYMRDPNSPAFGNPAMATQLAYRDTFGDDPKTEGEWNPFSDNTVAAKPFAERPAYAAPNASTGGSSHMGVGGAGGAGGVNAGPSPIARALLNSGADLRRPLSTGALAQQFAAPPVSAPAVPSMPNAQPGAAPNADLAAAKNAIAAGKSRQAVIDRLLKGGYNAQQIQAAGI